MSSDRYNIYENIKPGKLSGVIHLIFDCYNIKYSLVIVPRELPGPSPSASSAVRTIQKTIVGLY